MCHPLHTYIPSRGYRNQHWSPASQLSVLCLSPPYILISKNALRFLVGFDCTAVCQWVFSLSLIFLFLSAARRKTSRYCRKHPVMCFQRFCKIQNIHAPEFGAINGFSALAPCCILKIKTADWTQLNDDKICVFLTRNNWLFPFNV